MLPIKRNNGSKSKPSQHSLAQSQKWKHQNNVSNLFKGNIKDIRTTLMPSSTSASTYY